ncbi:alpha/beta-hydrolase [Trematosphaeria pertusa]|uniref:Alpha/beta-hydrolase n=1 Tax=Trematosphaeria pertusa TaxID=390896 RepID=A0A6A6I857_9PLEO|nr:alpha/beta-hydrolase [Trematosphaeria pertusa]KAF2245700.1 alpha/beta-hydrolase [Trematosphaeria pertusa]
MSKTNIYLDPLNQAVADELASEPPIEDLTVKQFRALFKRLQQHDPIPGVTRTSFTVPFEDGVQAFVFKPSGARGDLPVIFYLHGGGWIFGDAETYDSICTDLALQTGFAVVFPEYTLCPEARYPTQQEQCYAVVKWVSQHGRSKGLSQSAFAVVGDSAGGQLGPAVTILCSTRKPTIPIQYQVFLSPVTDTVTSDRDTPSEFRFFNGPFLTVPFMRKVIDMYIPTPKDRTSELATPQNISPEHAKKQPPTLIINSAVDPLRDDGLLYGQILQEAGIDCTIITAHGQLHDSSVLEATRKGPTPRTLVLLVATEIKNRLIGVKSKRILEEAEEPSKVDRQPAKKRRKTRKSY